LKTSRQLPSGLMFADIFETRHGWAGAVFSETKKIHRFFLPREKREAGKQVRGMQRREFERLRKRVSRYYEGMSTGFGDFALDLDGYTFFEKKVYGALAKVRFGTVVTYLELAKMAGRPRAARAVGLALAKNRLPLLIPCHRVIRSDGTPGGFSGTGGIYTKRKMLELEKVRARVYQPQLFSSSR